MYSDVFKGSFVALVTPFNNVGVDVKALAYTQHTASVGVDAALHVMGFYNRPNQEGIYQHFNALGVTTTQP